MRYGLMTNLRRSWSKVGMRAVLPQQQAYSNEYLFSALNPITGDNFHLLLPSMTSETMFIYLTELKKQHVDEHVVVVIDNAPCHRKKCLHEIEGLTLVHLPSYSPELNPAERYFEEIRRITANRVFESLDAQAKLITQAVNDWADNEKIKQLTGYEWILKQFSEVC